MTMHWNRVAGFAVLAISAAACSSPSSLDTSGAGGGAGSVTAGSGGGGAGSAIAGSGGGGAGPIDEGCPANLAQAIATMADCSDPNFPSLISCGSGYAWSIRPSFSLPGRSGLACFYSTNGTLTGSLACDNGPGDGAGECHAGGAGGSLSGCGTNPPFVATSCTGGGGGAGGAPTAPSSACPPDFAHAMADLAPPATGCADATVLVESCDTLRTWARLAESEANECDYATDGSLVGSTTCRSGMCQSFGTLIDDFDCTSVSFSSCGLHGN